MWQLFQRARESVSEEQRAVVGSRKPHSWLSPFSAELRCRRGYSGAPSGSPAGRGMLAGHICPATCWLPRSLGKGLNPTQALDVVRQMSQSVRGLVGRAGRQALSCPLSLQFPRPSPVSPGPLWWRPWTPRSSGPGANSCSCCVCVWSV